MGAVVSSLEEIDPLSLYPLTALFLIHDVRHNPHPPPRENLRGSSRSETNVSSHPSLTRSRRGGSMPKKKNTETSLTPLHPSSPEPIGTEGSNRMSFSPTRHRRSIRATRPPPLPAEGSRRFGGSPLRPSLKIRSRMGGRDRNPNIGGNKELECRHPARPSPRSEPETRSHASALEGLRKMEVEDPPEPSL